MDLLAICISFDNCTIELACYDWVVFLWTFMFFFSSLFILDTNPMLNE